MSFSEFTQNLRRRASEAQNTSLRHVISHSGKEGPDGRAVSTAHVPEYMPAHLLGTDNFGEWNMGDELPKGGPLPLDRVTNKRITAIRAYGAGTREDPMVLFSNKEILKTEKQHKETLEAYIAFAKKIAIQLQFTHIWIRKQANSRVTLRNATVGKHIGETRKSQPHVTVLLGNAKEWVNVGGHVFVNITDKGERIELISSGEKTRLPSPGEYRRVIELWKWADGGYF